MVMSFSSFASLRAMITHQAEVIGHEFKLLLIEQAEKQVADGAARYVLDFQDLLCFVVGFNRYLKDFGFNLDEFISFHNC